MPYTLTQCRHGQMLVNPKDVYVGLSLLRYGEFSEGEVDLFEAFIQPDSVVIEVGANIGAHTVPIAKRAKCVYAFEPQRLVHQLLCANLALNSLYNVAAIHGACGATCETITVPAGNPEIAANFGGVSLEGVAHGEPCHQFTIDSLKLPKVDFIKADVEGMERQVFEGAIATLAYQRPVLYFENDRPAKSKALLEFVEDMGYAMWWHMIPLYSEDNLNACKDNVFGHCASLNVLAIPKEIEFECGLDPVTGASDWPHWFKTQDAA